MFLIFQQTQGTLELNRGDHRCRNFINYVFIRVPRVAGYNSITIKSLFITQLECLRVKKNNEAFRETHSFAQGVGLGNDISNVCCRRIMGLVITIINSNKIGFFSYFLGSWAD